MLFGFVLAFSFLCSLVPAALAAPMCKLKPPQTPMNSTTPSGGSSSGEGSSGSGSGSSNHTMGGELIAASWYAGWHAGVYPPSMISWDKYNYVIYSFAITTTDPSVVSLDASDASVIPQFVSLAHQNGANAAVSVGGWTGSRYFSSAVATEQSRASFVKAIVGLITTYNLDGIDFDWEYPGKTGIGCNEFSPNDSANFLLFLQALRKDPVGAKVILSVTVPIFPWLGPNGSPLTDVSEYAKEIDFISLLNYDVWGSWSGTKGVGPNSPLDDSCAPSGDQEGSAVSSVAAWTAAGFPPCQIVLGVASYGHSFYVTAANALSSSGDINPYPQFDNTKQPVGDMWDAAPATDVCGNATPQGGIFDFWGLIQGGFLKADGTVADGIAYRYDNCSQTPYVYNKNTQVMVSYDDARSFTAKGQFIAKKDLRGFAMWQTAGDSNDILLDAIGAAAGDAVSCS